MDLILKLPTKAYDYVQLNYGFIGLLVAGLVLIMFFLSVYFWFDRRRA